MRKYSVSRYTTRKQKAIHEPDEFRAPDCSERREAKTAQIQNAPYRLLHDREKILLL